MLVIISLTSSDYMTTIDFEGRWITRPPTDKEFPYAVYIEMSNADDRTCSGSLITLRWVLTAARCMFKRNKQVENKDSLTVYAGVDQKFNDTAHVQTRKSAEIYISTVTKDLYFSLALVKLEHPFDKIKGGKVVSALPLTFDYNVNRVTEQTCKTGSYGRIEWKVERPVSLKKTMSLIQPCNCSAALARMFPDANTRQWECGEDAYNMGICKGDFGAAIKCGKNFIGIAINIVTFKPGGCSIKANSSEECSNESTISIYTDVCYHLEWIHSHAPEIPANSTVCFSPNSALSVHVANSWHIFIYILVLLHCCTSIT